MLGTGAAVPAVSPFHQTGSRPFTAPGFFCLRPPLRSFANQNFSERDGSVQKKANVRKIAMTAILSAVATVLMFLSFSLPIVPSFLAMDFSELPALIASFSMGPVSGVAVCFIKNLINLPTSGNRRRGRALQLFDGHHLCGARGPVLPAEKEPLGRPVGFRSGGGGDGCYELSHQLLHLLPFYVRSGMMSMEAIMDAYQLILPSVQDAASGPADFQRPLHSGEGRLRRGPDLCRIQAALPP